MKKQILILSLAIVCSACSSKVSLESVQKQEEKASAQLASAKEEMIELANMKEQYSEDHRDAQIKSLEAKQKQLKKDLKNLGNVESEGAKDAAEDISENLEKEQAENSKKITQLQNVKREDWSAVKQEIEKEIEALQQKIDAITKNLAEEKK